MEGVAGAATGTVELVVLEVKLGSARACLVKARHEATDVQVRQLDGLLAAFRFSAWVVLCLFATYGLPSLSSTTPFGSGLESLYSDSLAVPAGDFWLERSPCPLY